MQQDATTTFEPVVRASPLETWHILVTVLLFVGVIFAVWWPPAAGGELQDAEPAQDRHRRHAPMIWPFPAAGGAPAWKMHRRGTLAGKV